MINVLIIGFGNIAHAIIASACNNNLNFFVYSESYQHCNKERVIYSSRGNEQESRGTICSYTSIGEVIEQADIILFCVPSHVRRKYLEKFQAYFKKTTIYGGIPGISGFNEEVESVIGCNVKNFSLQRVPYISRCLEHGVIVSCHKKDKIFIACNFDRVECSTVINSLFDIPIEFLDHFDNINLSNSNPLLHTARIYTFLINNGLTSNVAKNLKFYEDWDNSASEQLLDMDSEFMALTKKLKLNGVVDLKEHYGISNAEALTYKIRSIEAFKDIVFPIKEESERCFLDFNSRYFKEDFEHGLAYIKRKAENCSINTPQIDNVLDFYEKIKFRA